jgi:hypothetical protein
MRLSSRLLKGLSSIWCMWSRLFLSGTAPHCSHKNPRFSIRAIRCRMRIDAEGLVYSLPCLKQGFSSPDLKALSGRFFRFDSDAFRRLSSVHILRRLCSAVCSARAFAFTLSVALVSSVCCKTLDWCLWIYTFHFRRDWLHSTGAPQPQAHSGASPVGKIFLGDGFPLALCPFTNRLRGLTVWLQPHSHNLFMPIV